MPRLWTIRNDTMDALSRGNRARYVKQLVDALVEEHPAVAQQLGAVQFHHAVERGIMAAAKLGIDTEDEVAAFADLWIRSDQDIEGRWPWTSQILRNTQLEPRTRLELIQQMMA